MQSVIKQQPESSKFAWRCKTNVTVSFCDLSSGDSNPTSVIEEELERALDAVEEPIDDHVVDVLHVRLPLLRGLLPSEQLQIFLTRRDAHTESSLPHLKMTIKFSKEIRNC